MNLFCLGDKEKRMIGFTFINALLVFSWIFLSGLNFVYSREKNDVTIEFGGNNITSISSSSYGPADIAEGYAVVAGVSNYPGSDYDLEYCDDDAYDMRDMLISEFYFNPSHITCLTDSSATEGAISSAISSRAAAMDPEDSLFFYFSGHGSSDFSAGTEYTWNLESSHPYSNNYDHYWHYQVPGAELLRVHFVRIDTETNYDGVFVGDNNHRDYADDLFTGSFTNVWSNWVFSDDIYVELYTDGSNTDWGFQVDKVQVGTCASPFEIIPYDGLTVGITEIELNSYLSVTSNPTIVLLDTCMSGGVGAGIQAPNRYIMTACESSEFSMEDADNSNGLFTQQFFNSWATATDGNGDGELSFEEIYPEVRRRTLDRSTELGWPYHVEEFDSSPLVMSLYPVTDIINGTAYPNESVHVNYSHGGLGFGEAIGAYYNVTTQNYSVVSNITDLLPEYGYQQLLFDAPGGGFNPSAFTLTLNGRYENHISWDYYSLSFDPQPFSSSSDADGDGLNDYQEYLHGTNPWSADTDFDGMSDTIEVNSRLNPFMPDANYDFDNDTLPNHWEAYYGLDPFRENNETSDVDGEGLPDHIEYLIGSDPSDPDTDDDLLNDYIEYTINSDLFDKDTDDDMFEDGFEYYLGNDPTNNLDTPVVHFATMGCMIIIFAFIFIGGKKHAETHSIKRTRPSGPRPDKLSDVKTEERVQPTYGVPGYQVGYGYYQPSTPATPNLPQLPYDLQQRLAQLPPQQRAIVERMIVEKAREKMLQEQQDQEEMQFKFCVRCGSRMDGNRCPNCGYIYYGGSY